MSLRCCPASSVGGYFLLGTACFIAGVVGTRAFEATPDAAEIHSPFTGQVLEAGYVQPEDAMDPMAMMEMMKAWAEPTEEHKLLEKMAGTWECTTEFNVGAPELVKGTGSSESHLVLGGRYVTQHFKMPDFMGMPFEGMGATGYDKAKGTYTSVWMDNFNTALSIMEGTYDEDKHVMTWEGEATYPDGTGGTATVPIRHVVHMDNPDTMVMEFWEPNPATGEMMHNGTITYKRSK